MLELEHAFLRNAPGDRGHDVRLVVWVNVVTQPPAARACGVADETLAVQGQHL
jgi:hypothetical protein